MASCTIILETWEGFRPAHGSSHKSDCGQTVKVRHHQNNDMIFASIFTVSALQKFALFLIQAKNRCQEFILLDLFFLRIRFFIYGFARKPR